MANPNKINFNDVVVSGQIGGAGDITFPTAQWTPADGSGAALAFTIVATNCVYIRIGQLLIANFKLIYPVTADTNPAAIVGLPFLISAPVLQGGYITFCDATVDFSFLCSAGNAGFTVQARPSGGGISNAQLSAATVGGTVIYLV